MIGRKEKKNKKQVIARLLQLGHIDFHEMWLLLTDEYTDKDAPPFMEKPNNPQKDLGNFNQSIYQGNTATGISYPSPFSVFGGNNMTLQQRTY